MITTKREYTLGIWALGLGYFIFYAPYSGLIKAVSSGLLSHGERVSGFVLLPSTVISTTSFFLVIHNAASLKHREERPQALTLPSTRWPSYSSQITSSGPKWSKYIVKEW